ncbi:hypothetical protein SapgrDRAFT_0100 [Saprospira grandis DSM 2844]|uniref:Uncharacterized protein n=1 Tax=Saprospira grandis DSM 2844 TaxID=694433 RepID=J0NWH8_9BACT|nr:hypothetical protein SapgrDRAFT_0100 [Saprospira grandis DSM 2844]
MEGFNPPYYIKMHSLIGCRFQPTALESAAFRLQKQRFLPQLLGNC